MQTNSLRMLFLLVYRKNDIVETTAALTSDRNQTEQSAPTELPGDKTTSIKLDKGMVDLLLESELFFILFNNIINMGPAHWSQEKQMGCLRLQAKHINY